MTRLTDDEISVALDRLGGWTRDGDQIAKSYERPTFLANIDVVNRIAALAEAANHHPDLDIRWRALKVVLTTHDQGGLTEKDFDMAAKIDRAVES